MTDGQPTLDLRTIQLRAIERIVFDPIVTILLSDFPHFPKRIWRWHTIRAFKSFLSEHAGFGVKKSDCLQMKYLSYPYVCSVGHNPRRTPIRYPVGTFIHHLGT